MTLLRPDPSFYPSPRDAMAGDPERFAYVATLDPAQEKPDAISVVDVDERSSSYGQVVGRTDMPVPGDELHHFGWNACSAALCPYAPHPHVERRYLVVPGLRSSRIHVLDTKEDPVNPKIVKVIEPAEIARRTGYSRPHTSHCGPDALYMSALGAPDGEGPGGIFMMDHETFEPLGRWEIDRGPQYLAYDFWWHLGYDTLVTSEWGTPNMVEGGSTPSCCSERGTAAACTCGISASAATSRPSRSARRIRSRSSCDRRTTPPAPMASYASSPTWGTWLPPSGCGT
jgi:selenium-binding protein 1